MKSVGATVFVVSKEFYDAHIFIDSFFMRGPGWHNNFVVRGELVQCALHAEPVSADPRLLRKAVEARWLAFRDQPAAPLKPRTASVPSVIAAALRRKPRDDAAPALPTPRIIAAGDKPRRISLWEAVKITLPLIGIVIAGSNLLGLWATDAQTKAYEKRREAAESRARYEKEQKALDERLKKQRQETDDLMRRTLAGEACGDRFPAFSERMNLIVIRGAPKARLEGRRPNVATAAVLSDRAATRYVPSPRGRGLG